MVVLQANSNNDLVTWSQDIAGDVVVLRDEGQSVYSAYKEGQSRPQYVVIDRDMSIILKTSSKSEAESKVLELLE